MKTKKDSTSVNVESSQIKPVSIEKTSICKDMLREKMGALQVQINQEEQTIQQLTSQINSLSQVVQQNIGKYKQLGELLEYAE